MQRDFTSQRNFILGALAVVVAADLMLGVYSWSAARNATSPRLQLEQESRQYILLKADVKRAEEIRKNMPSVQQECDRFEKGLPSEALGYSVLVGELGELAQKATVRKDAISFKEKEVPNHPLMEVQVDLTVSGRYASVVRFVNNIQKSRGLYILDELTLASSNQPGTAGQLRVVLHMRTYFRAT